MWYFTWYFLAKAMRVGPDMDSPVDYGGEQHLGQMETPGLDDDAPEPAYVRHT